MKWEQSETKSLLFACAAILFVMIILLAIPQGNTQQKGPIQLFNGKNLDGFYVLLRNGETKELRKINEDPFNVISVRDGMVCVTGREFGHFITKNAYENYRLVVEWKWGEMTWEPRKEKARDSGILIHCVPPDKVWNKSIEYQIIEGGTGDYICVDGASLTVGDTTRTSGRFDRYNKGPWEDRLGFRHEKYECDKPVGEWNISEIICNGDKITNIVNGVVVNEGRGANPSKGQILFQSECAEIFFRKIELHNLQ